MFLTLVVSLQHQSVLPPIVPSTSPYLRLCPPYPSTPTVRQSSRIYQSINNGWPCPLLLPVLTSTTTTTTTVIHCHHNHHRHHNHVDISWSAWTNTSTLPNNGPSVKTEKYQKTSRKTVSKRVSNRLNSVSFKTNVHFLGILCFVQCVHEILALTQHEI